jgi:putative membrane protein
MKAKLVSSPLVAYHIWIARLIGDFRWPNPHAPAGRWFNEAPSLLLIGIVLLAVVRPS